MANIKDVKYFARKWSELTYAQGIEKCYCVPAIERKGVLEILDLQKLSDKKMDGHSVEKIPYMDEREDMEIRFADVFHECINNFLSPAQYIACIVMRCKNNSVTRKEAVAGVVGRGLRAFPAFIRELDLEYKLYQALRLQDNIKTEICVRGTPKEDAKEHTDIKVIIDGDLYRIWSYQNTKRGIENTAKRVSEERGRLIPGTHVLCPFDAGRYGEYEEYHGWYLYTNDYVNMVKDIILYEKPIEYEILRRDGGTKLKTMISTMMMFKKDENV